MNFDFTARYMRNFSPEISHAATLLEYAFMKNIYKQFKKWNKTLLVDWLAVYCFVTPKNAHVETDVIMAAEGLQKKGTSAAAFNIPFYHLSEGPSEIVTSYDEHSAFSILVQ